MTCSHRRACAVRLQRCRRYLIKLEHPACWIDPGSAAKIIKHAIELGSGRASLGGQAQRARPEGARLEWGALFVDHRDGSRSGALLCFHPAGRCLSGFARTWGTVLNQSPPEKGVASVITGWSRAFPSSSSSRIPDAKMTGSGICADRTRLTSSTPVIPGIIWSVIKRSQILN